jgi:hypothetical protein
MSAGLDLATGITAAIATMATVLPVAVALRVDARHSGPPPVAKAWQDYDYWRGEVRYYEGATEGTWSALMQCTDNCESIRKVSRKYRALLDETLRERNWARARTESRE